MENKNGQGIFLGVVGVATLVVAIIGATFAFFSAQAQSGEGDISGQTLGGTEGGVLTLEVTRVTFTGATASSTDLVPTNITTSNFATALANKCESTSGEAGDTTKYTGCQVFKIEASSGSPMASASLKLTSLTATLASTNATASNVSKYHYIVYTASDDAGTGAALIGGASPVTGTSGSFNVSNGTFDMHQGAALGSTPSVYYLMVYIENANESQNNDDTKDITGSYTGTLTLEAAGGSKVMATFS